MNLRRALLLVTAQVVLAGPGRTTSLTINGVAAPTGRFEAAATLGTAAADTRDAANALVDAANNEFSAFYWGAGGATGTIARAALTTGVDARADLGYRTDSGIILGMRIGSVLTLAGANLDATSSAGDHLVESWDLAITSLPVLVGGSLDHYLSPDIHLRGSLFAGPAFGKAVLTDMWELSGPTYGAGRGTGDALYQSTTFAADVDGEFDWDWTRHLTLVIGLGYRYCKFISMRVTANADVNGDGIVDIPAGDALQDGKGRPVPFSFSGITTRFGLRWRFDP